MDIIMRILDVVIVSSIVVSVVSSVVYIALSIYEVIKHKRDEHRD